MHGAGELDAALEEVNKFSPWLTSPTSTEMAEVDNHDLIELRLSQRATTKSRTSYPLSFSIATATLCRSFIDAWKRMGLCKRPRSAIHLWDDNTGEPDWARSCLTG